MKEQKIKQLAEEIKSHRRALLHYLLWLYNLHGKRLFSQSA